MGTGPFPGVKSGRGVSLTSHHLLVPLVMKQHSYTSTPPVGRTACTEPQCLYKGCTLPLPFINKATMKAGTEAVLRNLVFHFVLVSTALLTVKRQTMDKVQEASNLKCVIPCQNIRKM